MKLSLKYCNLLRERNEQFANATWKTCVNLFLCFLGFTMQSFCWSFFLFSLHGSTVYTLLPKSSRSIHGTFSCWTVLGMAWMSGRPFVQAAQHCFQIERAASLANNIFRHFSVSVLDNNFKLTWTSPSPSSFSIKWQPCSASGLETSSFALEYGGLKSPFSFSWQTCNPSLSVHLMGRAGPWVHSLAARVGAADQSDGTGWEHGEFNVVTWCQQEARNCALLTGL